MHLASPVTPQCNICKYGCAVSAHFSLVAIVKRSLPRPPMAAVQPGGQSVDLGEIIDGAELQL